MVLSNRIASSLIPLPSLWGFGFLEHMLKKDFQMWGKGGLLVGMENVENLPRGSWGSDINVFW